MKKSYFTLLGLIIVLLIIAVLTSVMLNAYFFKSFSDQVDGDSSTQSDAFSDDLQSDANSLGPRGMNSANRRSLIDAANQARDAYESGVIERQKQYDMIRD